MSPWAALLSVDPAPTDVTGTFLQYGAVGAIALLAVFTVRVLWQRDVKARQAELDRAIERADRLEAELQRLNATVQEQTLHALNDATRAVADAMARMRGTS